jgi:ubiquinol oxidase
MVELTPEQRRQQQRQTLELPPRSYGVEARVIFWLEDRAWGTQRTLPKFKAREFVARSPYRAWAHEHAHASSDTEEERNERSHWNVLRELIAEDECREDPLRYRLLPAVGAVSMYAFTRLQHRLNPSRSHRVNADIEDHAAHEYALLVAEHPEWEERAFDAESDYGRYESRADVLRQIGCDEQVHKERSMQRSR